MAMTRSIFAPITRRSRLSVLQSWLIDEESTDSMGRNELCFCGSGKEQKNCHEAVNEHSLYANLLYQFDVLKKRIASAADQHTIKFSCKSGCTVCCNDYFYTSLPEFLLICKHLSENNVDRKPIVDKSRHMLTKLKAVAPLEYERLSAPAYSTTAFNDSLYVETFLPCALLDDNGRCTAYAARPFICHLCGSASVYDINCGNVTAKEDNRILERMDLPHVRVATSLVHLTDEMEVSGKQQSLRPYPIFWFFANYEVYVSLLEDFGALSAQEFYVIHHQKLLRGIK